MVWCGVNFFFVLLRLQFSIKQLREILQRWDEPCKGCSEKYNFITRIEELRAEFGDRDPIDPKQTSGKKAADKSSSSSKPAEEKKSSGKKSGDSIAECKVR